jgi:glycosyltransferase involved in cell wall biosynthesis
MKTGEKTSMKNSNTKLVLDYQNIELIDLITLSIVVPIFNQEEVIEKVLTRIIDNTGSVFELILIDDASNDNSIKKILQFFSKFENCPNLAMARLYKNSKSKYETFCDDFGFRHAIGRYGLEIQADMFIDDKSFDLRMIKAMETDKSIVALSGRGVENLRPIIDQYSQTLGTDRANSPGLIQHVLSRLAYQLKRLIRWGKAFDRGQVQENTNDFAVFEEKSNEEFLKTGEAGRLGKKLEMAIGENFLAENKIFIGQTVMRGPFLVNRQKYLELGGFDTNKFFQGFDDHDFCARVYRHGLKVGYVPIRFDSPIQHGTTRKTRSVKSEISILINTLRISKTRKNSMLNQIRYDGEKMNLIENEVLDYEWETPGVI